MRRHIAIALVVLVLSPIGSAQTQFGTVTGRVTDAQRALIPDAQITLTNTATNIKQTTKSDENGLYLFANVPAASYELTVEKPNFRKSKATITVEVAQRLTQDFSLEIGPVSETVNVTTKQEIVNTTSGEI